MNFQNGTNKSGYKEVAISVIEAILVFAAYLSSVGARQRNAADVEPIASPRVIEEMAGECEITTLMVMPDADTTATDYQ